MTRKGDRLITDEQALKALELISEGKSLRQAATEIGVKVKTLHDRLTAPEYLAQYVRAKEEMADALFDDIDRIANRMDVDNEPFIGSVAVQRDKLRIDAIKWKLSKLLPKKYGDKVDIEHSGEVKIQNIMPEDLRKKK